MIPQLNGAIIAGNVQRRFFVSTRRLPVLALSLICTLFFVSCGGSPAPTVPTNPYAALNGNWYLSGQDFMIPGGPQSQGPYLGVALGVVGNTVYARGNVGVNCSRGNSGIGGTISATGSIASDGTFVLTNTAVPLDSLQFTIEGTVPPAGTSTWQGTYALVNSASETSCTFNQSGSFNATQYPPFTGTYVGAIKSTSLGTGLSVTLQVTQGTPTLTSLGTQLPPVLYVPVSGSIAVTGSSCFASGQVASTSGSVGGDAFMLVLSMNDGSTLHLNGWYADQTEATLQAVTLSVLGGQCAGEFGSGPLTKQ